MINIREDGSQLRYTGDHVPAIGAEEVHLGTDQKTTFTTKWTVTIADQMPTTSVFSVK